MNKQNFFILCLISLFVLACGIFGNSEIYVKADDFQNDIEEKSSAVVVRKELSEVHFVIANYDLDLSGNSVQSLKKLESPGQVRVTFGIKSDFENLKKPFDYKGEKIKWVDIYYFKDGQEKIVSLKNIQGNITIGNVRENDVIGGIYVFDGEKAVRGTFTAKIIH